jgi:hypothetical protein
VQTERAEDKQKGCAAKKLVFVGVCAGRGGAAATLRAGTGVKGLNAVPAATDVGDVVGVGENRTLCRGQKPCLMSARRPKTVPYVRQKAPCLLAGSRVCAVLRGHGAPGVGPGGCCRCAWGSPDHGMDPPASRTHAHARR